MTLKECTHNKVIKTNFTYKCLTCGQEFILEQVETDLCPECKRMSLLVYEDNVIKCCLCGHSDREL